MRTFDHESLSHIQDLSNLKLNQTSPHNGQQELSSRIGIMKSAAARMLASNYSKDQESADDGFDSSTNNLITSSKQRVQHIDQVSFISNQYQLMETMKQQDYAPRVSNDAHYFHKTNNPSPLNYDYNKISRNNGEPQQKLLTYDVRIRI